MIKRRTRIIRYISIAVCLILAAVLTAHIAMAQSAVQKVIKDASKEEKTAEKPEPQEAPPAGPTDEYDRGTPRSSFQGFLKAAEDGDFKKAANYLDLHHLPTWMDATEGPELARQLKIVLDRALWVDPELISTNADGNLKDGLPANRDSLGHIKAKTSDKSVDILLQLVPRQDGVYIWKFSNRTVAEIPFLYTQFGYGPFEERLSKIFPDIVFLGWQLWQWFAFLVFIVLSYLVALVPTWFAGLLLRRRNTETSRRLGQFIVSPVRILLWILLIRMWTRIIGPSVTLRGVFQSGLLLIFAFTWASIRLIDIVFDWWAEYLRKSGREGATVLLEPTKTASKIVITLIAVIVWLDNMGFDVGALIAGLGVGGIAVALAAQDTIKNFIGSIIILLDKPYLVGQRIAVKGHDGVVEEIGLRSTKMRLLNGHQATIPNGEMAGGDIENIGRRPHIRRLTSIPITYNTPLEKIEKAVVIIQQILDNHEGMHPEFPPRVYFNEFNPASLNILFVCWYHPPDYWRFLEFSQRVNMQIMREFRKEGIKFALPTTTTYLAQDDGQPLQVNLSKDLQLSGSNTPA